METRYYSELAAAFVRGRLDLPDLPTEEVIALGLERGLRLHDFKRGELSRVSKVIGILKGIAPAELLDIGSGRGASLWALLDALPELAVTAVDLRLRPVTDIAAVRRGGVERLRTLRASVLDLGFCDAAFDAVTALEVVEHLERPAAAARELLRVARRFVVASVPSKIDDNPEHVQFFTPAQLRALFRDAGARDVHLSHVLNHRIAVVKV